jgi:peptidoglycan/LPS O-acetylase OafA/YrhL
MADPAADRAADPGSGIAHQPALDGLRAVAVVLVVLFHGGVGALHGGYIGVSIFFTLSGYLITTLLLRELDRTGTITLGRFYARRVRRLLPASLACLTGVTVLAALGRFDAFPTVRRDLLGSLLQVENWVKLAGGASYADLTNATLGRIAPLEHYWSLAIEEQFYWIWPLALLWLARRRRDAAAHRRVLTWVAVVTAAAAPVVAHVWGPNAAYWATPARVGEIMVGALLAALLVERPVVPGAARWAAIPAAAVLGWAAVTWPAGSGPAYAGWLPALAVATAVLLWSLQVDGPARQVLSLRPLVALGGISYGVYLYHWPVFAVLDEPRVGWRGGRLLALRLGVTLVLAVVSAVVLERPVRRWQPSGRRAWRVPLVVAGAATAVLAAVIVVVVPHGSGAGAALEPSATRAPVPTVLGTLAPLATVATTAATAATGSAPPAGTTGPAATTVPASPASTSAPSTTSAPFATAAGAPAAVAVPSVTRPVRILVTGDSTAIALGDGLVAWAGAHPDRATVVNDSIAGCGFLRVGTVPTDGAIDWTTPCRQLLDHDLPRTIAEFRPDVVVLMVTMRDVEDHRFNAAEGVIAPFDQRFVDRLRAAYATMADTLAADGVAHIAWVLPPYPIAPFQGDQRKMLDHRRYDVQFGIIRDLAAQRPERITVVDLAGWLTANGLDTSGGVRPDGLHLSATASEWISDRFVAGTLVAAAAA